MMHGRMPRSRRSTIRGMARGRLREQGGAISVVTWTRCSSGGGGGVLDGLHAVCCLFALNMWLCDCVVLRTMWQYGSLAVNRLSL